MNQGFSSAAILLLNMRLIAFPGRKITRIQLIQLKGVDHVSKATSNKFIALRVLVLNLIFPLTGNLILFLLSVSFLIILIYTSEKET